MARLLGTSVILFLLIISVHSSSVVSTHADDPPQRRTFLSDFIAIRKEVFPFSSDTEQQEQEQTSQLATSSPASSQPSTFRQTRHSGPISKRPRLVTTTVPYSQAFRWHLHPTANHVDDDPASLRPSTGQAARSRLPSQKPSVTTTRGRPVTQGTVEQGDRDSQSGRKIDAQGPEALYIQYTNSYAVKQHERPTSSQVTITESSGHKHGSQARNETSSYQELDPNTPVAIIHDGKVLSAQDVLHFLRNTNFNLTRDVEVQQRPVEVQQRKVEVQERPVKVQQRPAEVQLRPLEVQQRPAEVQLRPVEVRQRPAEVQQRPVEVQQRPTEVQLGPVEVQQRPVEVQQRPVDVRKRPVELQKRPTVLATDKPTRQSTPPNFNIFSGLLASLRRLPVLGNVLRATVDPIYRPILNSLLPMAENRQSTDEVQEEVSCFGSLGCIVTTVDFYDPIIRPINLPPDTRESVNTHYTLYTRKQKEGVPLSPHNINKIRETTYNPKHGSKFIIHGFLDDQNSTWIKDMVRGLLLNGDHNVFTVDWSGGSRVIYHQAVSNIRVVGLEVSALINWLHSQLGQDPGTVHVIGHSLGSHTAGHVGERVPGLGRITGLDPAEPFFQYMPPSVRLDYTDANFVDVIHTDTDSIMTLAWQLAGFGLEQPLGHVDFYPNGGRNQPGCSSLSRIPLTALQDGAGITEGLDAAEKEAVACNHIRASKLFTASLMGSCSFLAFPCQSYKEFEKAKCFSCDGEEGCAPLGIHADTWQPNGQKHVKMYLSTSQGPHYCQYHYRLTLTLADEKGQGGSLRGRLKVTLITQEGELKDFDLTESSPLSFRRGTTRTFLLRHGEDLSATRDALLYWQFEADVFNPLTFCVLFCTAELEVATVTLTPLDTPLTAGEKNSLSQPKDIVMCHKQGNSIIKIKSEKTIKISAEPFCPEVKRQAEGYSDLHTEPLESEAFALQPILE